MITSGIQSREEMGMKERKLRQRVILYVPNERQRFEIERLAERAERAGCEVNRINVNHLLHSVQIDVYHDSSAHFEFGLGKLS